MTANTNPTNPAVPNEDVVRGGLFALLAIPVGVILLTLLSSVGFVASIVGFVVAYCALWLYRRGSGGFISRVGAWAVTAVVVASLLIGIWASLVVGAVGGLGQLSVIGDPRFWPLFSANFGSLLSQNAIFILLILAFGALGAFRTLGRAFVTARQPRTQEQIFGEAPTSPSNTVAPTGTITPTSAVTPTSYENDVDGAPSGSADDKTKPPTSGL
ncbi:MAG: hypothetical protein QOI14_754 [Actinomycetota bacterium]|nr:hypothetical protein [Actinomycetota bacterium]